MRSKGDPTPATTSIQGKAYFRWSDYDSPFWAVPNTYGGRWHHRGDGPTQYLSASPNGAWAEKARYEGLQTEDDLSLIRTSVWIARVHVEAIVDYSSFGKAEAAGFSGEALIDDDHARCRDEGARLRELGYHGVVAPSAALPGVQNLTLFGPRVRTSWLREPTLSSSIPACIVAVGGPAPGLASEVRQHGQPHAEYERHLSRSASTSISEHDAGDSQSLF